MNNKKEHHDCDFNDIVNAIDNRGYIEPPQYPCWELHLGSWCSAETFAIEDVDDMYEQIKEFLNMSKEDFFEDYQYLTLYIAHSDDSNDWEFIINIIEPIDDDDDDESSDEE